MKSIKFSFNYYQVLNNINTWFVEEDCDWNQAKGDLDYLCGELGKVKENNSDPTEQSILEPLNYWQRYTPWKQLTCIRKVHDFDYSWDEAKFEKITYFNREGSFEGYLGYLDPKIERKKKLFWWTACHHRLETLILYYYRKNKLLSTKHKSYRSWKQRRH